MPEVTRPDGAVIHYQIEGNGYPVLALAPGGVGSAIAQWRGYLIDPLRQLADAFTVIAMDQRFAGASRAPLTPFSYHQMLDDQIAVLDAAGIDRAHVIGADFGAAHALRLAYDAPARVTSATLIEPVGIEASNDIGTYYARFNHTIRLARAAGIDAVLAAALDNPHFEENPSAGPWAQRLHDDPGFREAVRRLGRETYITLVVDFRDGMIPWGRRFLSITDPALSRIRLPMLVVPGRDALHPPELGQTFLEQASNVTLVEHPAAESVTKAIRAFLHRHTP